MKTIELTETEYKALVAELEYGIKYDLRIGLSDRRLNRDEMEQFLKRLQQSSSPKRRRIIFEETGKPPEIGDYYFYGDSTIHKRYGDGNYANLSGLTRSGLTRRDEEF